MRRTQHVWVTCCGLFCKRIPIKLSLARARHVLSSGEKSGRRFQESSPRGVTQDVLILIQEWVVTTCVYQGNSLATEYPMFLLGHLLLLTYSYFRLSAGKVVCVNHIVCANTTDTLNKWGNLYWYWELFTIQVPGGQPRDVLVFRLF